MDPTILEGRLAILKNFYFYVVSFVALMMIVFSVANMIDIVLKTYVFTKADFNYYSYYPNPACDPTIVATDKNIEKLSQEECDKMQSEMEKKQRDERVGQKQRDLVRDISFLVVGIPLFLLHWGYLRRNKAV